MPTRLAITGCPPTVVLNAFSVASNADARNLFGIPRPRLFGSTVSRPGMVKFDPLLGRLVPPRAWRSMYPLPVLSKITISRRRATPFFNTAPDCGLAGLPVPSDVITFLNCFCLGLNALP